MATPPTPTFADLVSLSPADVRTALLARGIGLSEPEVEQALALLKQDVAVSTPPKRGRLALGAEDGDLRAGSLAHTAARGVALEFAVAWFTRTFFVDR